MPSYKCDNGKWKWGKNGSCKYDSKKEADDANKDYYRNIKIVSGSPCAGKNTYVKNNKRKGDIVWDFDKIHSALTDQDSHIHIENVRKHIFAMRENFYKSIKTEKEIDVWIINSSPYKKVRQNLIEELNAEFIYLKRSKEECLNVARNERPKDWMNYIENYFDNFEEIEEKENIKIIEIKRDLSQINLTPTKAMVDQAKRGKELRKEFGRGGTEVGLKTANMIIDNQLTIERIKKMYAYFQRHEVDKKAEGFREGEKGYPSAGKIAWMLWGGDPGMAWSTRKRNEIEKEGEKRVSKKIKTALENKVKKHNDDIKDMNKDWNLKVTFKTLEKVFDRGVGAYHTNPGSVRPSVKNPETWALARVNSFLYALKNGKFRSGKHDTDLLPNDHPVVKKMKEEKKYIMKKEYRNQVGIIFVDDIEMPVFDNADDAVEAAKEMGWNGEGDGFHIHMLDDSEIYMPFNDHEEIKEVFAKEEIDQESEESEESDDEMIEENAHHCDECMDDCDEGECEKGYNTTRSTIWENDSDLEKRYYDIKIEKRKINGKSNPVVVGHAAVFDSLSEDLGGFKERIDKSAFDDVLENDVRAFFNHDPNHLLARTSSGTLKLSVDEKGLKYEFSVPDTTSGRDLLVSMERGDITQSSFAFTIQDDSWNKEGDIDVRTIKKVKRLYDVSPVSIPAYPGADDLAVAKRSKHIYNEKQQRKNEEIDLIKRNLLSLNLKILKKKKK